MADAVALTDAAIERYKPKAKRRRIRDAKATSLFLIIEPSGHKSWQMRFRRPDGKPAKITLGPYGKVELKGDPQIGQPLSLKAAHQLAAEVHRHRALGADVVGDHKARKHRQRAEIKERAATGFAACARQFVVEHKTKSGAHPRRWRETARLLGLIYPPGSDLKSEPETAKGGLAERWADKPVAEIDGHDVWSVIDEARRMGIPGRQRRNKGLSEARARALFATLSNLFGWLQRHRRIAGNPVAGVHRPSVGGGRDRTLSADEIQRFWKACSSIDAPRVSGAPRPFCPLLRLLLLSGQRLNEVAGMTRHELGDDGIWRLPGERTKNHREHIVPLPPMARDLIPRGKGKFVFSTTGSTPVSGWSRLKRRLDAAMLAIAREERGADATIPAWRLHDLRRTAVTGMAELGIQPHVIELVVNHVSGTRSGVAGTYNKSELMPERKAALERWAAHVEGLVSGRPAKVVALRRKGK
jgi:integrase